MDSLDALIEQVRSCRACSDLPLGPRPVFQISSSAKILVSSQAPGTRVHASGIPFDDPSGDRLRAWMGVSAREFYDAAKIAILPMGLCYPGRGPSGDAPPRQECAPLWRPRFLELMPSVELTLLVGSYAQLHMLGPGRVTDRVRGYRQFMPGLFPLPHPSWRSRIWMKRNPWFEGEVLPVLQSEVKRLLA